MRFLTDQDVYAATSSFLEQLGHYVIRVSQRGMAQSSDEEILKTAEQEKRILVTRDRDYGSLVFLRSLGAGVLYLRILPSTLQAVHSELKRVLSLYSEEQLKKVFVVIEPDGHRVRKPVI